MSTIRATITELKRRRSSPDGNPRFYVVTKAGGSFSTKKDAQVGYTIQNFVGQEVTLTTDENNEVTHVEP